MGKTIKIAAGVYLAISVAVGAGAYVLNDGALPWWGAVLIGVLWPLSLLFAAKVASELK